MMPSIIDIEKAASRLRQNLRATPIPELRLLCGLRFFALFAGDYRTGLESYLREFTSQLAEAARKSRPAEFLPEEAEGLNRFIDLIKAQTPAIVGADDISPFDKLMESIRGGSKAPSPVQVASKGAVTVSCLFVEHYPDLDLAPRGRILDLTVTAVKMPAKAEDDDIVVRNPLYEPDDRFLAQARDSIHAARAYLHRRYGLPLKKRYRFDLAVDSSGARFTGDSLGVAFAVGAVVAVAAIEVFRERLSVAPMAAFSGALSADGKIEPIDGEALKLKIYRAFHSGLAYLVIPRQHITDAWEYLATLEKSSPGRKLELVGADDLDAVISDPRLLPARRSSAPAYVSRKALAARRSVWLEVPALVILAAILFVIVAPARWMPWFDDNPAYCIVNTENSSLETYSGDSLLLWADTLPCPLRANSPRISDFAGPAHVLDIDDDGMNEVIYLPRIDGDCDDRAWIRFYSHSGSLMYKRNAAILNRYRGDSGGVRYDVGTIYVAVVDSHPAIISIVAHDFPARTHIRVWRGTGDSLGWYINWGHCGLRGKVDLDQDGSDELLFLGFSNSMERVSLFALDPDSVYGFSPFRDYSLRDHDEFPPGTQIAYLVFPVSDVGRVSGELPHGMNMPGINGIEFPDKGTIKVNVTESMESGGAPQLIYFLDYRFRVTGVSPNKAFSLRRQQLVTEGKLQPILSFVAYRERIRDAVTYWTDSGWVTEGQLRAGDE